MNLIQQAVERAGHMEREGKVTMSPLKPVASLGSFTGPHSRAFRPPALGSNRLPLATAGLALLALLGGAALYTALARSQGDAARLPAVAAKAVPSVAVTAAPATATTAAAPAAPAAPKVVAAVAPAVIAAPPAPVIVAVAAPADTALDDVKTLVDGWARAWSARDVNAYLACYGKAFAPERGGSRAAWEKSRRQLIERRRSISVAVGDLRLERVSADRIVARYTQDYVADAYRETGTPKRLVLAREGSAWRIVAEGADSASASTP
jgi:hypothetical protein